MTASTGAQRQAKCDAAKRARGLKAIRNLWCFPDQERVIRSIVAGLVQSRLNKENKP